MNDASGMSPEYGEGVGEVVAMVLHHITAMPQGMAVLRPPRDRFTVQEAAIAWQQLGVHAQTAEVHGARSGTLQDRMSEMIGRAAVTGEQLGLAWTLDQELQRWYVLIEKDARSGSSMATRALAEMCGYYLLAAAHGLGNITLRTLMISDAAAGVLGKRYPKAHGFRPFSQENHAWPTLNKQLVAHAREAANATGQARVITLTQVLKNLLNEHQWVTLVGRRDTDYHRWRPPGLPSGGVPQRSMWDNRTPHSRWISGGASFYESVDHERLCLVAGEALDVLGKAMETWLELWPGALRDLGVPVFKTENL